MFWELYPFVILNTYIFAGTYFENKKKYRLQTLLVDCSHWAEGQCTQAITHAHHPESIIIIIMIV